MSNCALRASDLEVIRGGNAVLSGMSFEVKQGEVFALLGGNGAGKSTTLLTFMGLLQPNGGIAEVLGQSAAKEPVAVRNQIAYLPENAALYDHLTAWENLTYFLSLSQVRPDQASLSAALDSVSLPIQSRGKPLKSYSKGMRQKVAIALALLRETPVLLLDEPTSGLDPSAVEDFHNIIERLAKQGVAVLMVTHDLYGACHVAHRVGILRAGQLVEVFEADEDGSIEIATVRDLFLQQQAA
ncbi:MAG: ABC transporter ATP-binding protein [Gammaproteobacteria bacterium]|jgi:ABC-2 type transport system ATP-binding protein|nr:ABC transporter ATP-binding protein [Gammaproteobacteria bacterium]MDG2338499.1 ABC transporter ATP-binding protein [Gammaproteobacteria bacterium]